jgi:hypothetical protein
MKRFATFAASLAAFVAGLALSGGPAQAMPTFAQATGAKCELCHTQVPTLNAYGRYVQRTNYAALDPHQLHKVLPVWIGEQLNYDSSTGYYKPQGGNLAVHVAGALGSDVTFHFQQWIWQNNQAGDLDTFWASYNKLFNRDGHLVVGKYEVPGPSFFSQWVDIAPFQANQITVGEHAWETGNNRWGGKFAYVTNDFDVEAGWGYSNAGWSGFSDFAQDTDKTFQYKVAWAKATNPFEIGIIGSRGGAPTSLGIDQYWSIGGYAQRDPKYGVPGVLVQFQNGYDAAPGADANGNPLPSAYSTGYTGELYDTFFHGRLWLSAREEWTQDGLGTFNNYGYVNASITLLKYLRFYAQESMQNGMTPTWQYYLWLTTPIKKGPNGW